MPAKTQTTQAVTQLLVDWSKGDQSAAEKLFPLVYGELKRTARRYLQKEKPGHTLQTTRVHWQNRSQFYGIAAQMMRRILVDHARSHARLRRGGQAHKISLDDIATLSDERAAELISLDEALDSLAKLDARRGRVVELLLRCLEWQKCHRKGAPIFH